MVDTPELLYTSTKPGILYTYRIDGDVAVVLDPKGSKFINGLEGSRHTDEDRLSWAIGKVNQYNKEVVTTIFRNKLQELGDVYLAAELSTVVLSDGNVFNASKSRGENPNRSINNTLDLIKKAVDLAIYFKEPSVTLSDANNNDVVYNITYTKGIGDQYILPVVELGLYMNLFFTLKRTINNKILLVCSEDKLNSNAPINVDDLLAIEPAKEFEEGLEIGKNEIIGNPVVEEPVTPPTEEPTPESSSEQTPDPETPSETPVE